MKKWYAYIILLASVLFASCNIEDTLFPDQECDTKTEPVNVRLILSMMGGEGMSRALTDEPTGETHPEAEPSLGNEYYINPYDVEVLVFTCDDTPENSKFVERASMVRASETNDYYQYQLDGTLTEIQEGTDYRIVVLANMNGSCYSTGASALVKARTTMKEYLESLVYTGYSASFTAGLLTNGSTERIPMWGTTAAYLNDGATITLNMLRAMSKVKVKMAKSLGDLSAVTLEYANPSGYVTPFIDNGDETTATNANGVSAITNNDAETKTITGGNTQRVRTPRIPTDLTPIKGLEAESTLSFSDVSSSTDNYEYVIYIPEYKNLGSEATPARMKLTIGDKPYKLEFKDYSETNSTDYFDIIRNYYYQYTITGVNDGLSANLNVIANKWIDATESWEYTDNPQVGENGMITWLNATPSEYAEVIVPKTDSGHIPLRCTFNLSAPLDGTWHASLIYAGGVRDAFKLESEIVENGVTKLVSPEGKVGQQATLVITALNNDVLDENNQVRLKIVVRTKDNRTLVANLCNVEGYEQFTIIQNQTN